MDMMQLETKLEQLKENVWAVEQGMVRSFLIVGSEKALLFDTGAADINLPELIASVTSLPVTLVLSHSDGDHTAALAYFPEACLHPAEEAHLREDFRGQLPALRYVQEGDVFDLGGVKLEVIHNPGHTPGSISLLDREQKALYSGDTVSYGPVFLFGGHRDPAQYEASLVKLQGMKDAFDAVYPCHNTCPVSSDTVDELLACVRGIRDGSLSGVRPEGMLPPGAAPLEYTVGKSGIYYCPEV